MKVDGESFSMYNGLTTSGWQWIPLDSYYLSEGDHTLQITYREDGAKMDKICISSYSFAPTGLGDDAVITCGVIETKTEPEIPSTIADFDDSKFKCYPNPFSDSTFFELRLEKKEHIEILVFNMLGAKVGTIINKQLDAGLHKIKWDAINAKGAKLESGIYLYQTVIGTAQINGKVEIIK